MDEIGRGTARATTTTMAEKIEFERVRERSVSRTLREVPRLEGESGIEARRRELFYLNRVWFMGTLLDERIA